jgi:hypothetical protein
MAWTTPGTAVAGTLLTSSFWNEQVRDNLANLRALANVQSTFKEDVFTSASVHDAFQDITGMSVSITPTASTSKVLVAISTNLSASNAGAVHLMVRLLRGATAIAVPTTAAGSFPSSFAFSQAANSYTSQIAFFFLDSPATTSATTYKIQGRNSSNNTWYVNQRGDAATRQTSSITVWEIPA